MGSAMDGAVFRISTSGSNSSPIIRYRMPPAFRNISTTASGSLPAAIASARACASVRILIFGAVAGAGAADGGIGVDRHAHQRQRLERAEEAADRQPVARHADPVIVVGGAEDAGEEDQPDDHVQPLFHHLAVGAGQADQQVGQEVGIAAVAVDA